MAIAWPSDFPYISAMFARKSLSRSGGFTVTGVEQVVASSTDFWVASISFKIHSREQILAYRGLQAQQWGRAAEWIIPACPKLGLPAGTPEADYSWSDDWSTDFSIGPPPGSIPAGYVALVTTLAARGARTITAEFIEGADLVPVPGMFFSIGNRLYSIATVAAVATRRYTITFAPGLRAGAAVSTALEFSSPRCLMRLTDDNAGQLDLDMLRFSDQKLNFVEVPG